MKQLYAEFGEDRSSGLRVGHEISSGHEYQDRMSLYSLFCFCCVLFNHVTITENAFLM